MTLRTLTVRGETLVSAGCREPGHRSLTEAEGLCMAALPWRKGIQLDELAWRRGMEGPSDGRGPTKEHKWGECTVWELASC